MKMIGTVAYHSWSGYAFEIVCLHHIDQLTEVIPNQSLAL